MKTRVSKDLAKQIVERPSWLKSDRDWQIFVDYRDSSQSAQDLGGLYNLGRAQIQNILNKILKRVALPGGLSVRALGVLRNLGLSNESSYQDFEDRLTLRYKTIKDLLDDQKHCGPKTRDEILAFIDTLRDPEQPTS